MVGHSRSPAYKEHHYTSSWRLPRVDEFLRQLGSYLPPCHEEVGVHPPSWSRTRVVGLANVVLDDGGGGVPVVMVIWTTPPGVGVLRHPQPWVVIAPLTRVEENGFAGGIQCIRLEKGGPSQIITLLDSTHTISLYWTLGSSCVPLILVLHQSIFTSEEPEQLDSLHTINSFDDLHSTPQEAYV